MFLIAIKKKKNGNGRSSLWFECHEIICEKADDAKAYIKKSNEINKVDSPNDLRKIIKPICGGGVGSSVNGP